MQAKPSTKPVYTVRKAIGYNSKGHEVPVGWDLLKGDEWCQRYRTRAEANEGRLWRERNA